jgi:hypothetical protein
VNWVLPFLTDEDPIGRFRDVYKPEPGTAEEAENQARALLPAEGGEGAQPVDDWSTGTRARRTNDANTMYPAMFRYAVSSPVYSPSA